MQTHTYVDNDFDPLEVFPKCKTVIKEKLREYYDLIDGLEEKFGERMVWVYKEKMKNPETVISLYRVLDVDYPKEDYKKQIKRLEHLLRRLEWKRKPSETSGSERITDTEIAIAKAVPLESLIEVKTIKGFVHCPFHYEKTASMKIDKSNRFHCFGCGADGDTVDYVMKKENLDFLSAVRRLVG